MTCPAMLPYLIIAINLASAFSKSCPDGTIPYPDYKKDPDSCYVILNYRVTWHWWIKHANYKNLDRPYKRPDGTPGLDTSVWSVAQARDICQTFYKMEGPINHVDTTTQDYWKKFPDFFIRNPDYYFRLPIIETEHENNFIANISLNDRKNLGSSFWIDLEFDPDTNDLYWRSTGRKIEADFLSEPAEENPEWEDNFVQSDDDDGAVRTCFVFVTGSSATSQEFGGQTYSTMGWHRRPCAQAYSWTRPTEWCANYAWYLAILFLGTETPVFKEKMWYDYAPEAVLCEMPWNYTTPTAKPTLGTRATAKPKTTTKKRRKPGGGAGPGSFSLGMAIWGVAVSTIMGVGAM